MYLNPSIINVLNLINSKYVNPKKFKTIIFCGSAPLHQSTLKQLLTKYKNCEFIQVYGLTETTNTIITNLKGLGNNDYEYLYFNEKTPSVGTPLEGVKIKILNKNKKIVDAENIIGEILVKGPNVIRSYVDNNLNKIKFSKGYLKTGDIGYFKYYKKKKFFYLLGRNDDIVQINGFNVSLNEVDNFLIKEKIKNTLTLALNDKFHGKQLVLATIDKSIFKKNLNLINKKLPEYMRLNKIFFFNKFYKTQSGKFQKNKMVKFIEKENLKYKLI
jgi:acyl-CoA synthetase (AMP-forming)/AMP-acid ligase II